MANAEKTTVTKTITTEVEEDVVVLTLTREEAEALSVVCAKVAGGGPRVQTNAVLYALRRAGVYYAATKAYEHLRHDVQHRQGITFADTPAPAERFTF
jgi:ribosomal protein S9